MNPNMPPSATPGVDGRLHRSPNLFRALRGPVMMMTLGSMLAFDHFTSYNFGDTWPLLLIAFGAMTLGEHLFGRGPASPYSGV